MARVTANTFSVESPPQLAQLQEPPYTGGTCTLHSPSNIYVLLFFIMCNGSGQTCRRTYGTDEQPRYINT